MKRVVFGVLGVLALGALIAAYGCRAADPSEVLSAQAGSAMANAMQASVEPVIVACEPGQQAVVRPSGLQAGPTTVGCVSMAPTWAPAAQAAWPQPRAVPAVYQTAPPVVTERRVVYERAPERTTRSGRSWQKSAIIIGSSAGIGAGVGGAIGGKKGALIGAAIGGGSATIWDQATRR